MVKIIDKRLAVPKWGLIVRLKITQMLQNVFGRSAQLAQHFWDIVEKRLHWESAVREINHKTADVPMTKQRCLVVNLYGPWDILETEKGRQIYCYLIQNCAIFILTWFQIDVISVHLNTLFSTLSVLRSALSKKICAEFAMMYANSFGKRHCNFA